MLQIEQALETFKCQVAKLAITDITPKNVEELKRDLGVLEYLTRPRLGIAAIAARPLTSSLPVCSAPGCKAGWREGLVNYAQPENDPVWYCDEHGLKGGQGLGPPGVRRSKLLLLQEAQAVTKRWQEWLARLTKELQPQASNEEPK